MKNRLSSAMLLTLCVIIAFPALAALSDEELAKLAQNPVANLISVPFQYNANLNYGPEKDTQSILNIQPVIPFELNKDWNLITRTIVPVIWQPALTPDGSSTSGIGPTQFSAFFSPADAQGVIWGRARSRRRQPRRARSSAHTVGGWALRSLSLS